MTERKIKIIRIVFLAGAMCLFASCRDNYHYRYFFIPSFGDKKINTHERPGFKILNEDFALDKNRVYYREESLESVDAKSFQIIHKNYFQDKNNVYYLDVRNSIEVNQPKAWIILIPVDLKIRLNEILSLVILKGVDRKNIKVLESLHGSDYAHDNSFLYYKGVALEKIKKKPEFLQGSLYELLKGSDAVYLNGRPLADSDPDSFVAGLHYAHDKHGCYYLDSEVVHFSCRPELFKVIKFGPKNEAESDYANDDDKLFYKGHVVPGVDAASFQIYVDEQDCYSGVCGRDKNAFFREGKRTQAPENPE